MAERNLFEPSVQTNQNDDRNRNRLPRLPENSLHTLQVGRYCLDYLQKCTTLKRPPQSLRASGLNRLPSSKRLEILSEAETKALNVAIKIKKNEIKHLETKMTQNVNEYQPLTKVQKSMWYKHYQRKISFYQSQQNSKWKDWPSKKNINNLIKKSKSMKTKERNIKKDAVKLLEEGVVFGI